MKLTNCILTSKIDGFTMLNIDKNGIKRYKNQKGKFISMKNKIIDNTIEQGKKAMKDYKCSIYHLKHDRITIELMKNRNITEIDASKHAEKLLKLPKESYHYLPNVDKQLLLKYNEKFD